MPTVSSTVASALRRACLLALLAGVCGAAAQDVHDHPVPEQLGTVSFPISCNPAVQKEFERGVALLHSFAYSAAAKTFRQVADEDPQCAIAHWGAAMTYFHQLWDPPIRPDAFTLGHQEIDLAKRIGAGSERERGFINALALLYPVDPGNVPYPARVESYADAMGKLATEHKSDTESQVFYALALLATASPSDKTHAKQKRAAEVLEPLHRQYPQHPGIAHYLIHAYDNQELAPRGVEVAEAYAKIAPSTPHALHMPSHIFTRLGMWQDSVSSNLAARDVARAQGDTGEELHAMDYLVYAYLQLGRDDKADEVVQQLKTMPDLNQGDFKIGYAYTAMPVRCMVERQQWAEAARIQPPAAAPQVVATAVWARALGLARSGHPVEARAEVAKLQQIVQQLRTSGKQYWAGQVEVQVLEATAWSAQAEGKAAEALTLLRRAADEEDSVEKLPVTPGPIVPAREQLGDLLLEQSQPHLALQEFRTALSNAPQRRGALMGVSRATEQLASTASRN